MLVERGTKGNTVIDVASDFGSNKIKTLNSQNTERQLDPTS